jgi:pyruvate/2-oxoglutarate/acetoin dehydrogenase E1 component
MLSVRINPSSREPGYPLQVISKTGVLIRTLNDTPVEEYGPGDAEKLYRNLATGRDGGVWVVPARRLAIEKRGADLTLLATVVNASHWIGKTTNARINGVSEDSAGQLWLIAARADDGSATRPAQSPTRAEGRAKPQSYTELARRFDSVIEVVDPRSGRAIVSTRFDAVLAHISGTNRVVGVRELDSGAEVVEVFRPAISTQR